MFKTPIYIEIPSFLLGAALALDMGMTLRPHRYAGVGGTDADYRALLSDFVVIGDDIAEASIEARKELALSA